VTTAAGDSYIFTDTVDTDCVTVDDINKCYCKQINSGKCSYWRNISPSSGSLRQYSKST